MRLPALATAGLLVAIALPAGAQQPPRRPRLARDADSNDAVAYFRWGLDRLDRVPQQAAAAFYWAARLDGSSPQTLYAEHVAILLSNGEQLFGYYNLEPRALRAPEVARSDSLFARALTQDPFMTTGLEEAMLVRYVRAAIERRPSFTGNEVKDGDIARALDTVLAESSPQLRGELSYSRGDYRQALTYWARAALLRRSRPSVHAGRARAFWQLNQLDSAEAALRTGLDQARAADTAAIQHRYESKAIWEYALGCILERRRNVPGAREAFQRSVTEDLSFAAPHLHLGLLALSDTDTSAAIVELDRAAELADADYYTIAATGAVLGRIGRHREAAAQLTRATALEPWASAGWLLLAREHDLLADTSAAAHAYEHFLALAPRADASRNTVTLRLAALRPH